MKFENGDNDWTDIQTGQATRSRRRRYVKVLDGLINEIVSILHAHAGKRSINASIPEGVFAKGCKGDAPTYLPIVMLTYDREPSYDHIENISTAITNALPIGRVIVNLTDRVVCVGDVQFIIPKKTKIVRKK